MCRYGDKLKRVDSTFPNEETTTTYICDSLGRQGSVTSFRLHVGMENTW